MYELRDRDRLSAYLRKNVALHLYAIGDLDPFFWPSTRWFAAGDGPDALCLLYAHPAVPALMVMCEPERSEAMLALLGDVVPELPDEVYVHRSAHLPDTLLDGYVLEARGDHHRMMLARPDALPEPDRDVVSLRAADAERLVAFFDAHYPGHWFDARMLDTGCYFGAEIDGELASVAGVHVMSREQRTAALGNIATATPFRGRGLGTRVTAAAVHHLRGFVDDVGLNVAADNAAAIACYEKLGFDIVADYREALAVRRG